MNETIQNLHTKTTCKMKIARQRKLDQYCEICFKNNVKLKPLTDEDVKDSIPLLEKFEFCACIKTVDSCKIPSLICDKCINHLRMAYEFRNMCLRSFYKLKQYLKLLAEMDNNNRCDAKNNITVECNEGPNLKSALNDVIKKTIKSSLTDNGPVVIDHKVN